MKKVTIIIGKQNSGKTTLAMEMACTKNAIWTNHLSDHLLQYYLTDTTEAIILDEITDFSGTVKALETLMRKDFILISKPQENISITRSLPEIIMISQANKENIPAFILEHSNLITL